MNTTLDEDLRRLHEELNANNSSEARQQLLAAIAVQAPDRAPAGSRVRSLGRQLGGVAAAAAVLVAVCLMLFSNGARNVAWSAVLDQLSRIHSIAWQEEYIDSTEGYAGSDDFTGRWVRCYLKEPNQFRRERRLGPAQYAAEDPRSVHVNIRRTEPGQMVEIDLYLMEQRGTRLITKTNRRLDLRRNEPGEAWSKLQALRERDVRELGKARFGGVPTVGFEAPIAVFDPNMADLDGTIRVWVHEQTAVPVRCEMRYLSGSLYVTALMTEIEWNPPLPDELFELPKEEGWQIEERVIQEQVYPAPGAQFKPGVTLEVTSPTGEVILTNQHIAAIPLSLTEGNDAPRTTLSVTLTSEGDRRLAEFSKAHIGEHIKIILNGEVVGQPPILAPLSRGIRIDIPEFGPVAEELLEPTTESEQGGDE